MNNILRNPSRVKNDLNSLKNCFSNLFADNNKKESIILRFLDSVPLPENYEDFKDCFYHFPNSLDLANGKVLISKEDLDDAEELWIKISDKYDLSFSDDKKFFQSAINYILSIRADNLLAHLVRKSKSKEDVINFFKKTDIHYKKRIGSNISIFEACVYSEMTETIKAIEEKNIDWIAEDNLFTQKKLSVVASTNAIDIFVKNKNFNFEKFSENDILSTFLFWIDCQSVDNALILSSHLVEGVDNKFSKQSMFIKCFANRADLFTLSELEEFKNIDPSELFEFNIKNTKLKLNIVEIWALGEVFNITSTVRNKNNQEENDLALKNIAKLTQGLNFYSYNSMQRLNTFYMLTDKSNCYLFKKVIEDRINFLPDGVVKDALLCRNNQFLKNSAQAVRMLMPIAGDVNSTTPYFYSEIYKGSIPKTQSLAYILEQSPEKTKIIKNNIYSLDKNTLSRIMISALHSTLNGNDAFSWSIDAVKKNLLSEKLLVPNSLGGLMNNDTCDTITSEPAGKGFRSATNLNNSVVSVFQTELFKSSVKENPELWADTLKSSMAMVACELKRDLDRNQLDLIKKLEEGCKFMLENDVPIDAIPVRWSKKFSDDLSALASRKCIMDAITNNKKSVPVESAKKPRMM